MAAHRARQDAAAQRTAIHCDRRDAAALWLVDEHGRMAGAARRFARKSQRCGHSAAKSWHFLQGGRTTVAGPAPAPGQRTARRFPEGRIQHKAEELPGYYGGVGRDAGQPPAAIRSGWFSTADRLCERRQSPVGKRRRRERTRLQYECRSARDAYAYSANC